MTYASRPSSEYRLIQLEGVAEVEECLGVAALLDIVPGRRTEAAYVLALQQNVNGGVEPWSLVTKGKTMLCFKKFFRLLLSPILHK